MPPVPEPVPVPPPLPPVPEPVPVPPPLPPVPEPVTLDVVGDMVVVGGRVRVDAPGDAVSAMVGVRDGNTNPDGVTHCEGVGLWVTV